MTATDAVLGFIAACKDGDYDRAARFIQITERDFIATDMAERIGAVLSILAASDEFTIDEFYVGDSVTVELPDFQVIDRPAIVDVPYRILFTTPTGGAEVVGYARTICESQPFKADPEGTWGVSTTSMLRQRRRSTIER